MGLAACAGDSSAVQHQLRGVQQIQSTYGVSGLNLLHTYGAFAASLEDGSVVTWGHALEGGESSEVRDPLKGVQQIQTAGEVFAAVREDCGGDSLAIQKKARFVWSSCVCRMARTGIILAGGSKSIATSAARSHAVFCLGIERGTTQFVI